MKLFRKVLALMLVITLTFIAVACQTSGGTDSKVPAEKIKIGFVTFTTGAEQFIGIKTYYEELAQSLNIEIVFSEAISTSEKELNFIENCAAKGCKGIIGYYNIARNESIQLAINKGMYYFGVAEEPVVYEEFKDNPYYLGGFYAGNADENSGYAMAKMLIDAGSKNLVYASGGADFGVKMFIDRMAGFEKAISEANAAGKDVKMVYNVKGWPYTPPYTSEQSYAISNFTFDGVASSFGISTWLQPLLDAGLQDSVKLTSIDALSETLVTPFENGQMVGISSEPTGMQALPLIMIINAVEGNTDMLRGEDGLAGKFFAPRWTIANNEDYIAYYNIETDGTRVINDKDIFSVIKSYNKDATFQDLTDLFSEEGFSLDAVRARRAAQQ